MSPRKRYPELPRKKLTPGWWLGNRHYTLYMLRELTSFFVAVFCLIYVYQVARLASSAASYPQYLEVVRNPFMVGFSIIALAFTLYHSLTWFHLIGKIQPLRIGGRTTTPLQALVVNTVLLAIISVLVIMLFFIGR